jgi:predicted DNA-binding protein (MmcQ/YjbR family)
MNIEKLRTLCLLQPGAMEEIQWGSELCFSIGGKPFCTAANNPEGGASFKVREDEFRQLSTHREGIIAAPYMERFHWVYVLDYSWLTATEWAHYIQQSYELVKAELQLD